MNLKNETWVARAYQLSQNGYNNTQIGKILKVDRRKVGKALVSMNDENLERHLDTTTYKQSAYNDCILVIPDLHAPYQHKGALDFLSDMKRKYKPTRIVNMGDECFPPQAEILTDSGWKRFDELLDTDRVAQWDDGKLEFLIPERIIKNPFEGNLLQISHRRFYSLTTPKHNLVKIDTHGVLHRREAWDCVNDQHWTIPRTGKYLNAESKVDLTDDEIRLFAAFQADGTFDQHKAAKFEYAKARKVERLTQLLTSTGVPYIHRDKTARDTDVIYIRTADVPVYFTKRFFDKYTPFDFSTEQREVFLQELVHWDGTPNSTGTRYVSMVHDNLEFVQLMATLHGVQNKRTDMYCDVKFVMEEKTTLRTADFIDVPYCGLVYCVTVPSGMILVKQNEHISVTGNCDKHTLSYHEKHPNLMGAGDELKEGKRVLKDLYKIFPDMDIMDSNHGSLHIRKAITTGIPLEYLKSYNEVLEVGNGWKWHHDLIITLPNGQDCYFTHGKSTRGITLSRNMSMNCVQGHYHSEFNINYWSNPKNLYWSMQVGCLVDDKSLAMAYNKLTLNRPILGCGVIVDSKPILETMPL